jgi:beta-glucanase (GH16 family)
MKRNLIYFSVALFLCATILRAAPPSGYGLIWSDEFDAGTTANTSNWTFDVGPGVPDGWGNAEAEYYTNGTNFTIENGSGVLWAKHETMGNKSYTSCRMNTKAKKAFKYGYFEARIKAARGNGLWPAFWTLGSDIDAAGVGWPSCGEVELYEQRTGPQQYSGAPGDNCFVQTCHFATTYGSTTAQYNTHQTNYTACLCTDYHLYAIEWDSTKITYFLDGNQTWQYTNINATNNKKSFHQTHFFIANIAVGGNYQGNSIDNSIFPQKMYIDYVRVYQKGVGVRQDKLSLADVKLTNPACSALRVYDLSGKLVADYTTAIRAKAAGANLMQGVSNRLPAGAYLVRFSDAEKVVAEKMVFTH